MKSYMYYIFICIISTILFIYTIFKNKDNKLIVLYFFIAGLTYFLEYFALVLFDAYAYYPRILQNGYFDNILGAVSSNAFTIPMITTLVAAFRFNLKKILLLASVITVVEIIFIRMRIYEHHWWRYYTFAGAVIVFYYSRNWVSILRGRINKLTRFITLFFSNLLIQSSMAFITAGILNLYLYKVNWFNNPYRGHVAFATLYIILITISFVSVVVFRLSWIWACIGILLPTIIDAILVRMNILIMYDNLSLINFFILRILIFVCLLLFNRYLLTEAYES